MWLSGLFGRATTRCLLARVNRTERGASVVEYALLVALIAAVCVIAVAFVGIATSTKLSVIGSELR